MAQTAVKPAPPEHAKTAKRKSARPETLPLSPALLSRATALKKCAPAGTAECGKKQTAKLARLSKRGAILRKSKIRQTPIPQFLALSKICSARIESIRQTLPRFPTPSNSAFAMCRQKKGRKIEGGQRTPYVARHLFSTLFTPSPLGEIFFIVAYLL